jgi:hypothetical protein
VVIRLHPVTSKEEVAVDVHVAAVIAVDLSTKSLLDLIQVEVVRDVAKARVAQVAAVLAVASDIIDVATSALVGAHHRIITVDGSGNARPGAARLVAALDKGLATGQGVVHALALTVAQDSGVATLTASHRAVVTILGVAIGKTVTDQNTLEVDVSVLVRENLRGENGNVVASIRLSSNVEVLLGILGKLVEEESEEGVNVLASSDSVAHGSAAIRVTNVYGLVKEDDGSVVVPRVGVVDNLKILIDRGRAKLKEETSQGGAARAAVEPENDGVVGGIIARLEEPVEKMLVLLLVVEITTVLLGIIDTKLSRVDLLGTQVVVVKLAADLAVRLAVLVDPERLDVGTLDDVIPVAIGSARVRLGLGSKGLVFEGLNGVGDKCRDLVPNGLGVRSELAKELLEMLSPFCCVVQVDDGLAARVRAKDLLFLEADSRRSCAQHEGGCRQAHGFCVCRKGV